MQYRALDHGLINQKVKFVIELIHKCRGKI
jgi:hypothetical protein